MKEQLLTAMGIVEELQEWIRDRTGLEYPPIVEMSAQTELLTITVDGVYVYDSSEDAIFEDLTFEHCRSEYLEHLLHSRPFFEEAELHMRTSKAREN